MNLEKLRKENIRRAKNSDIPVGCEYTTCEVCGTDTICEFNEEYGCWICEVCFYTNV